MPRYSACNYKYISCCRSAGNSMELQHGHAMLYPCESRPVACKDFPHLHALVSRSPKRVRNPVSHFSCCLLLFYLELDIGNRTRQKPHAWKIFPSGRPRYGSPGRPGPRHRHRAVMIDTEASGALSDAAPLPTSHVIAVLKVKKPRQLTRKVSGGLRNCAITRYHQCGVLKPRVSTLCACSVTFRP